MAHAFFLGVDFVDDESSDENGAATLTLIEKEKDTGEDVPTYRLDSVRHETDVESADALAGDVQSLVAGDPYIGRTSIVVNRSSDAGQALLDALEDRGLAPVAATLTGGMGVTPGDRDEVGVHMAEYDAVETLSQLYRDGRLSLETHVGQDVSRLARGIQSFVEHLADVDEATETPDELRNDPVRPESYDNYVTSAALAAWFATETSFDPSEHLRKAPNTEPPMGM